MGSLLNAADIGKAFTSLWESTGFKSFLPDYYLMHGYSLGTDSLV